MPMLSEMWLFCRLAWMLKHLQRLLLRTDKTLFLWRLQSDLRTRCQLVQMKLHRNLPRQSPCYMIGLPVWSFWIWTLHFLGLWNPPRRPSESTQTEFVQDAKGLKIQIAKSLTLKPNPIYLLHLCNSVIALERRNLFSCLFWAHKGRIRWQVLPNMDGLGLVPWLLTFLSSPCQRNLTTK